MSIQKPFHGHEEPRRDRPAETTGFETLSDMCDFVLWMMSLRQSGRFTEMAQFLTEDCEMFWPSQAGVSPFNGVHRGRPAVIAKLKSSFTLIEFLELEPLSVAAEGDAVVVTWRGRGRNRGGGPAIKVQGIAELRVRQHRVYYYANHTDTATLVALAGFQQVIEGL